MPEKLPYAWTELEAEVVKQTFHEARPAVPRHLVLSLWRYWLQLCPDRMLFDDDEDNIALVLHARAFGLRPPVRGTSGDIPARLAERLERGHCPLVPEQPVWGPRAALAPEIRAALPSLLVRAWVAVDDDHGPVEVLAVGVGLPEIRQQIVQAALTTSLRINGLTDPKASDFVADLIGVGLIRLSSGVPGTAPAMDIPSVFNARQMSVPERSASTARGVLRDFVKLLRNLERETDLVQVTEIRHTDLVEFNDELRVLADRAAAEPHTAFLRPAVAADTDLVSLLPNLRTVDERDAHGRYDIGLTLSPDLLATDAYQRLEEAHNRVLAHRLAMDAKLRRDRLLHDIAWLRREKEAFDAATPQERRVMWPPTVLLVERFDERLGVTIRLAEPDEAPTEVYYESSVPRLIRIREEWAERMRELVDNLEKAVSRPHAPARQLAAGRFVDAVLRGARPDESSATEHAFESWRADVQPMLWFEWRCALETQRIEPADLCTRHTVFVTRYLPAIGDDDALLYVHPYTIVDKARSAVLADAERGVLTVRDATDDARPETAAEADEAAARAAWDELVRLAERASTSSADNQFTLAFLAALRAHPRHIVERMIDELRPEEIPAEDAEALDRELGHARRAAELGDGMERALMAMRTTAFRTARQCLDDLPGASRWEARAWLLRAIVECAAAEIRSTDIPSILGNRMPGLPAAEHALDQAARLDAEFTQGWLRALPDTDLDKGIRRLFHGVPRGRATCSEKEYAVLLFRRAVESVRLARQLEEAAEELSEESEAADTALVKLGGVLEDILLGPYVGGSRVQGQVLFVVLTGQQPPTYGRLEVR